MLTMAMRMLSSSIILLITTQVCGANHHQFSRDDFPPPPAFFFGAGTSAYQVEGAASEDGRTPSIWDTFAHSGITHGANGDVACDQYHKYKEDVKLMVDTGLEAYRFSISWSRLIPNGRGPINPKALQYYNNLIDELISHGIQPHVTLHHTDLPQALEDEYGGWLSRRIVYGLYSLCSKLIVLVVLDLLNIAVINVVGWKYGCRKDFTVYADVCFRKFGDRVSYWTPFNEANVFVLGGYDVGILPPQRCSYPFGFNCSRGNSSTEPYIVAHHILLAHAAAARLYKNKYQEKQHGFIGINLFAYWFVPLTNTTEDVIATERANDLYFGWFLNPLVSGDYPISLKKNAGSRIPAFTNLESKQLKGSFDFLGLNYYHNMYVKDNSNSLKKELRDPFTDMAIKLMPMLDNSSTFEFPVTPWALQGVLEYFKQVYGNPPIYIHENGQRTRRNSTLEDWPRVKSLYGYIGGLLGALRNGSNTRGYFTWSFLDLFEMLDGYESSYGLYYVDLDDPDLRRQPKLSARWYTRFLKGKGNISDGSIVLEKNVSAHFFQ